MTPNITHLEPLPSHRLHVRFANEEARVFDVTPYLDKSIFQELRDEAYFRKVRPVWGGVEWPHEQDLSAAARNSSISALGLPVSSHSLDRLTPGGCEMCFQIHARVNVP